MKVFKTLFPPRQYTMPTAVSTGLNTCFLDKKVGLAGIIFNEEVFLWVTRKQLDKCFLFIIIVIIIKNSNQNIDNQ